MEEEESTERAGDYCINLQRQTATSGPFSRTHRRTKPCVKATRSEPGENTAIRVSSTAARRLSLHLPTAWMHADMSGRSLAVAAPPPLHPPPALSLLVICTAFFSLCKIISAIRHSHLFFLASALMREEEGQLRCSFQVHRRRLK